VLSGEDLTERSDRLLEGDETSLDTGEDLGDGEGLGHEPLDLSGTLDLDDSRQYWHTWQE
jgi:hypothetical protein